MRMLMIASLAALLTASAAAAHDYKLGELRIEHPYARATPEMAKTGVVYMTIENQGGGDTLISARTSAAASAMLHESRMQDGVMRMRALQGGLPLPAGGTVALAPGRRHIMLMGLKAPLQEGGHFPLTLRFEKAGDITVDVSVEGMAAGVSARGHKMQ